MSKPMNLSRGWLMVTCGMLFYCLQFFLRVEPAVMVNQLMLQFSITAAAVGALSGVYYFVYAPMQLFVGALIDHYGVRSQLTLAALVCVVGVYLFNITNTLWVAQLGRILIGFGSAFAFVGGMKVAADWLPERFFAPISGLGTSLGMLGAISGELFLSHLLEDYGQGTLTQVTTLLTLGVAVILYAVLRDKNKRVVDNQHKNQFSQMLADIVSLLKRPTVWLVGFVGSACFMSNTVLASLWAIPYLQEAHHFSHTDAASISVLVFVGWGVGSPLMGWLSNHFGCKRLLMVGSALAFLSVSALLYIPNTSVLTVKWMMFLMGLFCSAEILVFPIAKQMVEPTLTATAISVTNMIVMAAGALLQPLVGILLDWIEKPELINGVAVYSEHSFMMALSVLPVGLLLGFICTHFIPDSKTFRKSS